MSSQSIAFATSRSTVVRSAPLRSIAKMRRAVAGVVVRPQDAVVLTACSQPRQFLQVRRLQRADLGGRGPGTQSRRERDRGGRRGGRRWRRGSTAAALRRREREQHHENDSEEARARPRAPGRARCAHRSRRVIRTRPRPSTISPTSHASCPDARAASTAANASFAGTTASIPSPRLNTCSISSSATSPARWISAKIRGSSQRPASTTASQSLGQHPHEVAGNAAAGDVRERVHVDLADELRSIAGA